MVMITTKETKHIILHTRNLQTELTTNDFLWGLYEHVRSLYWCPFCRRSWFKWIKFKCEFLL